MRIAHRDPMHLSPFAPPTDMCSHPCCTDTRPDAHSFFLKPWGVSCTRQGLYPENFGVCFPRAEYMLCRDHSQSPLRPQALNTWHTGPSSVLSAGQWSPCRTGSHLEPGRHAAVAFNLEHSFFFIFYEDGVEEHSPFVIESSSSVFVGCFPVIRFR